MFKYFIDWPHSDGEITDTYKIFVEVRKAENKME